MRYEFLHNIYNLPKNKAEKIKNEADLIEFMKNQFISDFLKRTIDYSNLSLNLWSEILPLSKSTLQRVLKKHNEKIDLSVSEIIIGISEIYQRGLRSFNQDKERFTEWLKEENPYFNHKAPLEIIDSHRGQELIKAELHRIEYSEFS